MAEHITEEEQIEAFKRWWKENGASLVIGVVLAVGGYFGYQFWQTQQQVAREEASGLYNDLLETGVSAPGEILTDQDLTKINSIAEELKEGYKNTLYAHNASLLLAKLAVENNDLENAEQNIRWVLDNSPNDGIEALANLRLAVVLYSQDQLDAALQLVSTAPEESFIAQYAEVRGDILLAQGKQAEAQTAYQEALDNLLQNQASRRDMIQMKITDIESTLAAASPASESSESTVSETMPEETMSEEPVSDETESEQVAESTEGQSE